MQFWLIDQLFLSNNFVCNDDYPGEELELVKIDSNTAQGLIVLYDFIVMMSKWKAEMLTFFCGDEDPIRLILGEKVLVQPLEFNGSV